MDARTGRPCPQCSAAMVGLALISDPPVLAKILRHLRLPTAPPPMAPHRVSWDPDPGPLIPPPDETAFDEQALTETAGETLIAPGRSSIPTSARSPTETDPGEVLAQAVTRSVAVCYGWRGPATASSSEKAAVRKKKH